MSNIAPEVGKVRRAISRKHGIPDGFIVMSYSKTHVKYSLRKDNVGLVGRVRVRLISYEQIAELLAEEEQDGV